MKNARAWSRPLLWLHLFVCITWLYVCRFFNNPEETMIPIWMLHLFVWSILGIQFTWGFTVGLAVGPSRKKRQQLWWSLLTVFFPLWWIGGLCKILFYTIGPLALVYMAFFVAILACETYGGVLLGAKIHSESKEED